MNERARRPGSLFERYGIALIITLHFLIGSIGVFYHWGFPTAVNDETPPMAATLKMIADRSLRPAYDTFYYMPLSAYAQLPFVILGLGAAYLFGDFSSLADLERFVVTDFAKLLPAVRFGSVVFGALTLFLFHKMLLLLARDRRVALWATFLLATSLLFVQLSHFARVWSLQLCVMIAGLYAVARIWAAERLHTKDYAVVGLLAGVAFGVHIVGATILAALPVAHWLKERSRGFSAFFDPPILLAYAIFSVCIPVLYAIHPFAFAHYMKVIESMVGGGGIAAGGPILSIAQPELFTGSWAFYLRMFIEYEPLLLVVALLGAAAAFRALRGASVWLGAYGVAYVVLVTVLSAKGALIYEPRYALPLVPILAISGGVFLSHQHARFSFRARSFIGAGMVMIFLATPFLWISKTTTPETRREALAYITAQIPAGARVYLVDDRIPLAENMTSIMRVASDTPEFLTRKRAWYLAHPEDIPAPAYDVVIPAYVGGVEEKADAVRPAYAVASWWGIDQPGDQRVQLRRLFGTITFTLIARFPSDANNETESIDLANNMRWPAWKLWTLHQNGPIVEIYSIR